MIKVPRLALVESVARQVVRDHQISVLPVCPFALAASLGIEVQPKPMGEAGCSGMLIRFGDEFGIIYATHLRNVGYERFSVAHELGHYFLPGHPEHVLRHGAHQSHAGFASKDPYELEADFFAASLLMPPSLFRAAAARHVEGLEAIMRLAGECRTSITATAISYAKHGHAAVAVVLSTRGIVDFCFQSDAMKAGRVGWLRPGSSVPPNTVTERLASVSNTVMGSSCSAAHVRLSTWFSEAPDLIAIEEVLGLGAYGKILTVMHCARLTARSDDVENEDDEEEALLESWTPKFRR